MTQGFQEQGGPPDLATLQSTMHAIELACASIQVSLSFFLSFALFGLFWWFRMNIGDNNKPAFTFAKNRYKKKREMLKKVIQEEKYVDPFWDMGIENIGLLKSFFFGFFEC